jgi:catalase
LKILDGPMCVTDNQGGAPNYYPNSFGGPEPLQRARDLEPPFKVSGDVYRFDSGDEDNFTQARVFWHSVLDDGARKRLVSNIAGQLVNAAEFIQERTVSNFAQVSADFGQQLTKALREKRNEKN